jgi:hypothetical protein
MQSDASKAGAADARRYDAGQMDPGIGKIMPSMSTLVLILFVFGSGQVIASDRLCPEKTPLQDGSDDLRMYEKEFTFEEAQSSVTFLQTDFAGRIWGAEPVKDFSAWSGHYISYANSLKFIEGALLKQQALLNRFRLRELTLSDPNSPEISQAKEDLEKSIQAFCDLVNESEYVD